MPRASTQNARPALRRLPTRPSRMVQAVVSRLLPLLFRSQGLELSHRDAAEALALTIADANLKPSEMLDAGAALGQGSRALSSRSVAMDQ